MNDLLAMAIQLGVPLLLIVAALFIGTSLERKHYRSIDERERTYGRIALLNGRHYPRNPAVAKSCFVSGSVVISYDYFKRFLAGLRMFFGGEVRSYVSLLDRGRREAILRMKEKCSNADLIVNLRIETSSISKGRKKNSPGTVEVFAYGTALWYSASGDG